MHENNPPILPCGHKEYKGTGHCAEMPCANYVSRYRTRTTAEVGSTDEA